MIVFLAFLTLIVLTVANPSSFATLWGKSSEDWILDFAGLLFQGVVIPILQGTVVYQMYAWVLAGDRATLSLPPIAAFCLSFILVDYLYYWNHRLLHSSLFWPLHQVHHTVTDMQVLGTSRNTLWTSFFILYLWIHPLFIYLLKDPTWYLIGVSLTAALDLWRHSIFSPLPGTLFHRIFSHFLILPQDHAWHHANQLQDGNYGANLKWDKLHGTYYHSEIPPENLGIPTNLSLTQKLLWPF